MKRVLLALFALTLSACSSCVLFGPNLEPTVELLSQTIADIRVQDYETKRVHFSDDPELQAKLEASRLERLKEAENNAAIAVGKEPPHKMKAPEVKKED